MSRSLFAGAVLAAVLAATAAAAPGDPERRAINRQDQAWAKRANLRPRDVPAGFTATPSRAPRGNSSLTCAGFRPDLSDLTITGQALSPIFQSSGITIFSSAEVYKSVHDEHEAWRRTARREALGCVARMLGNITASGVQVKVTSRVVRPAPRVGDRRVSFRITATIMGQGVDVPAWIDFQAVARGRADASLLVMTIRSAPSAPLERKLLTTLAQRLKR